MKNIKWLAALLLLNNEVVSWIVITALAIAGLVWFVKEAANETIR